ncbi:MAG: peptide chain release factor N(5)-glutamine methyltransferase [Lachnospiraceae bacterium]|nr:peptide chain release factor N(5)-glutamine methyltransferase [Lachnospiraceae bacterium]
MNYEELLTYGEEQLERCDIENAKGDAFTLLEMVTGVNRTTYFLVSKDLVEEPLEKQYKESIEKRKQHIPLQYITGVQCFMGYDFHVTEDVLIPRYDTEVLVEEVLKLIHGNCRVLDMCTGSGCIIVSLKCMKPDILATGSDVSEPALLVAKENAKNNKAEVTFVLSDLFDEIGERYDIIVSNPPYIPSGVIESLDREVKLHEPYSALDGKEDGLYFYRKIIEQSKNHLNQQGWICFEIGYDQGKEVSGLLKDAGFEHIYVKKDLAGLDRVVIGKKGR